VGVSDSDKDWAQNRKIPGLLYDYEGAYIEELRGKGIREGHKLHADAEIYTFGKERAETPKE